MTNRQVAVFALVLSVLAPSCADSARSTEVVICLSATPQVMADAQTLVIRVYGRGSASDAWVERAQETRPIAALPLTLGVHPQGRVVERLFRVEVEARGNSGVVAVARMSSGFVAEETRAASLVLDHRCAATCAGELTCRGGTCVDATWATASLPAFTEGSCRATVDAGPLDQGSVDLGTDAGDGGGVVDAGEDAGPTDAAPTDGATSHDTGVEDMGVEDMGVDDMGVTMSTDLGTDVGPLDAGSMDLGSDTGVSTDAGTDGGSEVGRRLIMQLSPEVHAECPGGGWILSVYFDTQLAAAGPGEALDVRLPGPGAFVGDLGVSAFCPSNSNYRNWSAFTDQAASTAGFTTVTLDGVNLADAEAQVCNYYPTCPFGHPSYWTTPRVPLDATFNGVCTQSPFQCPDWCQSPC